MYSITLWLIFGMTVLLPVSPVGAMLLCLVLLTGYFFICKVRLDHFSTSFGVASVTTFPFLVIKKFFNNSLEISLLLFMRKMCKQGKQSIFSALFMFTGKITEVVFAEDFESVKCCTLSIVNAGSVTMGKT